MNKSVHAWYLCLVHFPAFLFSLSLSHPFSRFFSSLFFFFFSSRRRRIDCLRHPVPFCSSHYGRAAIEFPRVVFSGTIFNPVPWLEAESRVNRYDAMPRHRSTVLRRYRFAKLLPAIRASIGLWWIRTQGEEGGGVRVDRCKGSICDPNFSASSSSILMGRVSRCDNLSTRCWFIYKSLKREGELWWMATGVDLFSFDGISGKDCIVYLSWIELLVYTYMYIYNFNGYFGKKIVRLVSFDGIV